jgi:hypothetical protein
MFLEFGQSVALGEQVSTPSNVESDSLVVTAPSYRIEVCLPQRGS